MRQGEERDRSALQVLARVGIIADDLGHRLTGVHFRAVAAGLEAFLHGALADTAELFAVDELDPVRAAAFAVDLFRQDRHMVHFGPEFRGLLAQRPVIADRGEVRVAVFAVQAAAGDHGLHRFVLLKFFFRINRSRRI